jgi:hypothetical protein
MHKALVRAAEQAEPEAVEGQVEGSVEACGTHSRRVRHYSRWWAAHFFALAA